MKGDLPVHLYSLNADEARRMMDIRPYQFAEEIRANRLPFALVPNGRRGVRRRFRPEDVRQWLCRYSDLFEVAGLKASADPVSGIYFLEAVGTDLVKIGLTRNLLGRMRDLTTICPVPLVLRCFVPSSDLSLEGRLHALFKEDRDHGEWFRLSPQIERYMARQFLDLKHPDQVPATYQTGARVGLSHG